MLAALDALPHSLFMIRQDGRYIFQNAHDLASFGKLEDGDADASRIAVDEAWRRAHRSALAGEPVRYVSERLTHAGMISAEVFLQPVRRGGEVAAAVGIAVDQTCLIKARDELKAERSRLQDFLDCSSDWVWEQDEDFMFTHWHTPNKPAVRTPIGYTRWGFAGGDPDRDPFWATHRLSLERHEPIDNFIYRTRNRAGREIWVEISGRPVHDEAGVFKGYRGTARDVTARESLNQRLRHAELVVSNTNSAVVICDAARRITYVNAAFESITGYTASEVIGRSPGSFLQSPETDPETVARISAALGRGDGIKVEILNRTKAGAPYWIDMEIRPVRDEAGQLQGFIAVETDITEMVALRRRLMGVFENVPVSIVVFDEEGVITDCNREVERLTGNAKSVVIGMRSSDYPWAVFSDRGPPYAEQEHPVYVALRENRQVEGSIVGFTRPHDGALRWLKGNLNPIQIDGGRRIVIYSFSDITDEIDTQAKLRRALAETQRALSELGAYKAALDQHSIVSTITPDYRLTFVNDAFCKATGYSREEVIGRRAGDLLDSDRHTPEFYANIKQTLNSGRSWRSEICNRSKSGEHYWLDETVVPQHNERGDIVGFVSIAFDITERVKAEEQTRQSEARFRLLADNSSDVIIMGHVDGRRSYYSPSVLKLTGYTQEEALDISMREWVHPDDLPAMFAATTRLTAENPFFTIVHRLKRKDGSYIWVEDAFSLVNGDEGEQHIVANIRDVTERKVLEADYRNLFEHSIVSIYRKTLDGKLLRANPALVALRGFSSEAELLKAHNADAAEWHFDSDRRVERQQRLLTDGLITDFVSQVRVPYRSEPMWISETAWLVRDDMGRPTCIEGMAADVTERISSQAALEKLARFDVLTGLPNRASFCEGVDRLLQGPERAPASIIYVDLDRFKAVNDSHGHAAGDEVVREIGERLATIVAPHDLLARIGGDEFIILAREGASGTRAEQLAVQIIAGVNHPIRLRSGQFANVGASIGVATIEPGDETAEAVIRRADLAMYQAKNDGRNAYRRHTRCLDEQVALRQTIDIGLRSAIDQQQFELHFQPVFQAAGLGHAGFEALIRWHHPEHGMMSPAAFVPIAEETGMIVPIGEWVLNEALRQAATWPEHCRVAVNASVVQLRHPDFVGCVMAALRRNRIMPERLEIEVTESVLLDDSPTTLAVLEKLQTLGVQVALDDFGTGWSSLSYLNRHRFDRIKIDRSFVKGIADRRNEAIIRAIIDLGTRLGIKITGEGVETQEQLDQLARLGCHEVQGYLMGRPASAAEALDLASRHAVQPVRQRYFGGVR